MRPPRRLCLSLLTLLTLTVGCGAGEASGQAPTAILNAPEFCSLGQAMVLDGTASEDPDGDIVRFRFIIADGAATRELAGPSIEHICAVSGLIEVVLEVLDAEDHLGRASATVSVRAP